MRDLLARALPMLIELGDHIGNGPIDPDRPDSLGTRCDLIGDIKDALEAPEEVWVVTANWPSVVHVCRTEGRAERFAKNELRKTRKAIGPVRSRLEGHTMQWRKFPVEER